MSPLVTLALWGWIPLGALCFALTKPSRALLWVTFAGWMFLPIALLDAPFVDLSKDVAIAIACGVGALCFARHASADLRLRAVDLPVLVWCAAPMLSSLSNDLGAYDGWSGTTARALVWGVPYLLGRAYLADARGAHELARALVIGGLVYVPLCWIEIRLSPQLHAWIYGYHQHSFAQTLRAGGYRPQVFMNHGLMVGMWMCTASLVAVALWRARAPDRTWGMPARVCAVLLCGTTVMCRSLGALILMCAGLVVLCAPRRLRTVSLALVLLLPPTYVALRAPGSWSGAEAVEAVRSIDEERALSLQFRLDAEARLLERALEQPWFGWGGFSRAFVPQDEDESQLVISDSQWIIAIGQNGLVGLTAFLLAGAVPIWTWMRKSSKARLVPRDAAVGSVLALALGLYMVDNMLNAMTNPIFMLVAGSLAGWKPAQATKRVSQASSAWRADREPSRRRVSTVP